MHIKLYGRNHFNSILVQIAILVLSSHFASAETNKCSDLFTSNKSDLEATVLSKKESDAVNRTAQHEKKVASTTGDRAEYKFTTTLMTIQQLTEIFKKKIEADLPGYTLAARDKIKPGFKNITWTAYSNRFAVISPSGKVIILKVRLRKYGWIQNGVAISKENLELIPGMKDHSWLEFKIENDEIENSVIKPRVMISDADAQRLLDPKLTAFEFSQIQARMEQANLSQDPAQNSMTKETIRLMLGTFAEMKVHESKLIPQFETIYERASFKVPLKNSKTGELYEVQMTIDTNVSVIETATGKKAKAYSESPIPIAVIEFKIPTNLGQLIKSGLTQEVPGLDTIIKYMAEVQGFSIRKFTVQLGKLGHLRIELFQ